jgi:integrase
MGLQREHIKRLLDQRADRPIVANNLLKTIRMLMGFAVDRQWRKDNPTIGLKRLRVRSEGFRTWSEEEIGKFEQRWPIGTRERLALALLLCTAQRRADVVRMGRQHLQAGILRVQQQKTGTELEIPIHADLKAVLETVPANLTFLTTDAASHILRQASPTGSPAL